MKHATITVPNVYDRSGSTGSTDAAMPGTARKGPTMFDQFTHQAIAADRMSDARYAADLHRQRVALRRDSRSVLATWLQRLAMRLDARACSPGTGPARGEHGFATDRELCRAA